MGRMQLGQLVGLPGCAISVVVFSWWGFELERLGTSHPPKYCEVQCKNLSTQRCPVYIDSGRGANSEIEVHFFSCLCVLLGGHSHSCWSWLVVNPNDQPVLNTINH